MINKNYTQFENSQFPYYIPNTMANSIQGQLVSDDQMQYMNSGTQIVVGSPIQGFDENGNPIFLQGVINPPNYTNLQQLNPEIISQQYKFQNNQVQPIQYAPLEQHMENKQQNFNDINMVNPIVVGQEIRAEMFGKVYQPQAEILKITSREPQIAYCPRCRANMLTKVEYQIGLGTVISAVFIAFMGGTAGCCLIPCCIKDCKNAVHFCTTCNQELGAKKFIVK